MPGVAVNGSEINESVASGYVKYDVYYHAIVGYECVSRDEFGNCLREEPVRRWEKSETRSTGARITGRVSVPSSKMKVGGVNVATVGDTTTESWVADPPVPSMSYPYEIRNISPGTSGTGNGQIISGSTKGTLQGKPIALVGSQVRTCLGTTTTIKTGNEKLKFGS